VSTPGQPHIAHTTSDRALCARVTPNLVNFNIAHVTAYSAMQNTINETIKTAMPNRYAPSVDTAGLVVSAHDNDTSDAIVARYKATCSGYNLKRRLNKRRSPAPVM
jgi:hypothetical protein